MLYIPLPLEIGLSVPLNLIRSENQFQKTQNNSGAHPKESVPLESLSVQKPAPVSFESEKVTAQ